MGTVLARWIPPPMLAMFALFLVLPAVLPRFGYTYLGTEVMIWAIFALGYNLLLGYTGLPAFGHGAFFGIGGYLLGMTQKWVTGGLVLPLAAAAAGTLLLGAVVALFVARRRGIYFSLLTIAFGVMFWFMVFVFDAWTGGEDGLTGINRLAVLGYALRDNVPFYYFVYAWFVGATVVLWRIVNSPFGQVIRAIRQSETRARAVGYDTARYKWAVFTLSCGFAGLAGGLYALARFGAFAEPMSLSQSGNVVLMCLIGGGFASFYGPVLGVVVFLVLRDVLSTLTDHWMLAYGVLFMAVILFMPEGILGVVRRLRQPAGFHDTGAAQAARAREASRPRPPGRRRARASRDGCLARCGRRDARPGDARPPEGVRRPRRPGRRGPHVRARPAVGPDRTERRGQDDVLQPPDRLPRRRRGRDPLQGPGRHPPAARTAGRAWASAGPSRSSTSSTTTPCSRTCGSRCRRCGRGASTAGRPPAP